jgi:hypothetical protein
VNRYKGIGKMKLKIYLSMPFMILLAVITVLNWSDLAMLALGNALCIIAYVSLVGILDGEIKRIRAGASEFPKAFAVTDSEVMSMDKIEGRIEESVQEAPSS